MSDIIMDNGQDLHDFGTCCVCEEESKDVNNFIMLPYQAPVLGTGWGCFQCSMESNGAMAVVCSLCMIKLNHFEVELKFIIDGYPKDKKRKSLENYLKVPFVHNMELHDQYDGWTAQTPE